MSCVSAASEFRCLLPPMRFSPTSMSPAYTRDTFSAAGFRIKAIGGLHAAVLDSHTPCANLGYIVEDSAYHPGDALDLPDVAVETLFVPMQGARLKTEGAIAFVRAVAPVLAIGVHDGQINDRALSRLNYWLATHSGTDYRWTAPGTTI
jgi:hypothetical protein